MKGTVEGNLRKLFDFQRFVKEPGLQSVIDDSISGSRMMRLSEDDLDMVAAGTELPGENKNEITIMCECGWKITFEAGVSSVTCRNPKCKKIHYIKG